VGLVGQGAEVEVMPGSDRHAPAGVQKLRVIDLPGTVALANLAFVSVAMEGETKVPGSASLAQRRRYGA
jgi:hypothetical protein